MPTHRAPRGDAPAVSLVDLVRSIPDNERIDHVVPAGDEWVILTTPVQPAPKAQVRQR